MEALPIINTVVNVIKLLPFGPFPAKVANDSRVLGAEMVASLCSIKLSLDLIKEGIEMLENVKTQELVYDIEDFICRLWIPGGCGAFILSAIGMDPRVEHVELIQSYQKNLDAILQTKGSISSESSTPGSPSRLAEFLPSYAPEKDLLGIAEPKKRILELLLPQNPDKQLRVISVVGCRGLGKTALARALHDDPAVTDEFECVAWVVASQYNLAEDLLGEILQQVTRTAADRRRGAGGGSASTALRRLLKGKRYLIFIDDYVKQKEEGDEIKETFPENGFGSRIVVTTSVHSVATDWSSGIYVYKMQCLDRANSERLFWRKALRREIGAAESAPTEFLATDSEEILVKCDGLPLALISSGNYLGKKKPILKENCEDLDQNFSSYVARAEKEFADLKRALVRCHDSLPDYNHKYCLHYASIFRRGYQINGKTLVRRLIAEGLVSPDILVGGIAEEFAFVHNCLNKLMDESVIVPVLIHKDDSKVAERCKVQSVMLELTIHMSLSRNFVTLIHERGIVQNKDWHARRLIFQSSTTAGGIGCPDEETKLSTVRSLTIFKSDLEKARVYFNRCNGLRVLDLEGCTGLDKKVLDDICKLVLLKYLSLRKTDVSELPAKVKNLRLLQTLDIRQTGVQKLPVEVIMLPYLAYLFGKFRITDVATRLEDLEKFLLEESKLHTLSGIVIDLSIDNGVEAPFRNFFFGVEAIIEHAKMLKKVKLWCNDEARSPAMMRPSYPDRNDKGWTGSNSTLAKMLKKVKLWRNDEARSPAMMSTRNQARSPELNTFVSHIWPGVLHSSLKKRIFGLESLSIDSSNDLCNKFMGSLKAPCTISSIKLRGKLDCLPDTETLQGLRRTIKKLHLCSTGVSIDALSALQSLARLEYLKLAEDCDGSWDGHFVVKPDGFESLSTLCFEASKLPRVLIQDGAMKRLHSLQLLCLESPPMENASSLGVEGIAHLHNLNEVILHHSASEVTLKAWEAAAREHVCKPSVNKREA